MSDFIIILKHSTTAIVTRKMKSCYLSSFLFVILVTNNVSSFVLTPRILEKRAIIGGGGSISNNNNNNNHQAFTSPYKMMMMMMLTATKTPVFDEVCDTTGVTLKRFMSEVALLNPGMDELQVLFGAIETACKAISNEVRRSQLPPSSDALGYNKKDDATTKSLLATANDLLKKSLRFTGRLGVLASEREDAPESVVVDGTGAMKDANDEVDILIDAGMKYCAIFDPLDAVSNIELGVPTGTIIGIFEYDESCEIDLETLGQDSADDEARCLANTLQAGDNLVAAAYCLYSSSTMFVLTLGAGTYGFTLDESLGEFVLSHPSIQIPETSTIYSFDEARSHTWDTALQETVQKWKSGSGASGKTFSSRYIGSTLGDVHRTLMYGGVYGCPKDDLNPDGRLHLVYEAAPISFIMEQAGGVSTTGSERIMNLCPDYVHEKIPTIMGSKNDVQEIIDAYKKETS